MPHTPLRYVLNSLIYILITGYRWCDLPKGKIWVSKSAAHRWLKRWKEDGTFEHLQARILAIADSKGLINWNYGAIDGAFSPWKGRGCQGRCGSNYGASMAKCGNCCGNYSQWQVKNICLSSQIPITAPFDILPAYSDRRW